MADKRIIELEERLTLSDGDYLATDNTNGTCKVNAKILLDRLSDNEDAIATKAAKVDLTNISITGSTNNTGSTIASGTFFYKSGTLVRAKVDIANGATLTQNTNYEVVTAGGLNVLNNDLNPLISLTSGTETVIGVLDGKTLYRKIYSYSGNAITSDVILDATLKPANIDKCVKLYTLAYFSTGAWIGDYYVDSTHQVKATLNANGLSLLVKTFSISKYIVEVVYTKP